MKRVVLLAGTALLTGALAAPAVANTWQFKKVATITLPGAKGHGDMVTYDPTNGMLYVSMPNDVAVIDSKTNKVVADLKNIPSPNEVCYDSKYIYSDAGEGAGAGKTNAIVVTDKSTWKEVGRVTTKGTTPDGCATDRATGTLYVMSDDNNWIEKYKGGAHPTFEAKWPLYPSNPKSGPDVGILVASLHTIFQPDDAYYERVDTKTGKVAQYVDTGVTLTKHGGTKGAIYDAKNDHVWVGTTDHELLVMNPHNLKVIAKPTTHGGIDQVAFDSKDGLVYAFGGEDRTGFDVYDAKTMKPVAFVKTNFGQTHTGDVDTANGAVYAYAGLGGVVDVFMPETQATTGSK